MKLCLTVSAETNADARQQLMRAPSSADLVEIRIDAINDLYLPELLRRPRPSVIVTNRIAAEGGRFSGSEAEQFDILSRAMRLGAEYIDVELAWGRKFINRLSSVNRQTKMIASYHNFRETPKGLGKTYESLVRTGTYATKIATMASDISDNRIIFDLLRRARTEKRRIIGLCMGDRGQISRILTHRYGGFLTYAPLKEDCATAPGQLSLAELIKTYSVHTLNSRTRLFGLLGNPVSRSKGVFYHNRVFQRRKMNAVYLNFLADDISRFMDSFRTAFTGLSVTMPFKETIIPFLDNLDESTGPLGAVNTVVVKRGKRIGFNTDMPAVQALLKPLGPRQKNTIVLGTGGTAAAMACAARILGSNTTIVGRNREKTEELAERFDCRAASFEELAALPCDILMYGTSIGMNPENDPEILPPLFLKKKMAVIDAVYGGQETPLVARAREIGCIVIPGMELFERQAKFQSKLFCEAM